MRERLGRARVAIGKGTAQRLRNIWQAPAEKRIIFVAGVQRSGTNMLMNALEASPLTSVFHESDPRAYDDYVMRPIETLQGLTSRSPASVVVFKALLELQDLRALLDNFKPAKAVWIVRRFDDMVNSHLRKWPGCAQTMARIAEDRNAAQWRGAGMSDETHALVRKHTHPAMNDASAVALFWYFRNMLFFDQHLDSDQRVMPLRYETLVAEAATEYDRVFSFLDMQPPEKAGSSAFSSSVGKEKTPDIEPAIRALCDSMIERFDGLIAQWRAPQGATLARSATNDR